MINRFSHIFLILLGLLAAMHSHAQVFNFQNYQAEHGLPQGYVYDLVEDAYGNVWVATGEGLGKFDGVDWETIDAKDGLLEDFCSALTYRSGLGVLVGHKNGKVTVIHNDEIDSLNFGFTSKVTSIAVDGYNRAFATSQNEGLAVLTQEKVVKYDPGEEVITRKVLVLNMTQVLLATNVGLFKVSISGTKLTVSEKAGANRFKDMDIVDLDLDKDNCLLVTTMYDGLYRSKTPVNKVHYGLDFQKVESPTDNALKSCSIDNDGQPYVGTYGSGVYKYTKSVYDTVGFWHHFGIENGLLQDYVESLTFDSEGRLWVGYFGEGLGYLIDEAFSFYLEGKNGEETAVFDVCEYGETLLLGMDGALVQLDLKSNLVRRLEHDEGMPDDKVTCIAANDRYIVFGTSKNGSYIFDTETDVVKQAQTDKNMLSQYCNDIVIDGDSVWVATMNGIYVYSLMGGAQRHLTTINGLIHNNITSLDVAEPGEVWVSSYGNYLMQFSKGGFTKIKLTGIETMLTIIDSKVDSKGNFWVITNGSGVFKKQGDSLIHFSEENGLLSDFCYALAIDTAGNVMVGHRGGLSSVTVDNKVHAFDDEQGIQSSMSHRAAIIDKDNNFWFGSNNGIIKYAPSKDFRTSQPPLGVVKSVNIGPKTYYADEIVELPYGKYKVDFNFNCLGFSKKRRLRYSYFLEGHDLEWSEPKEALNAYYPKLTDGEYTFKLKTISQNGIERVSEWDFKFTIDKPYWKLLWVQLLAGLVLVAIIILIIKRREYALRQSQLFLESELDKRTAEIVAKNHRIERINRDMMSSINYAKRIQKAMLPKLDIIETIFPDMALFYKPRDVVSGDFYWYDILERNILIACADCTGHGVPGAMMSMVCSTAFTEVKDRFQVTEPGHVLTLVNKKLGELLTPNSITGRESEGVSDGMDTTLVSIEIDSKLMRYSGTGRPVIIIRKGETIKLKTEFGHIGANAKNHNFSTSTFQLEKDDLVYMFTDGLVDQFGGPKDKKMGSKRFINQLEKLSRLEMINQGPAFEELMEWWQQGAPQTDDMLLIGFKI